jgi:hypothetical protein
MKLFDTKINRYNGWNLSQRLLFLSKLEFGLSLSLSLSLSRKGLKKKSYTKIFYFQIQEIVHLIFKKYRN